MTRQGHEPEGGTPLPPPASTRWSEPETKEEDILSPPYIPARSRREETGDDEEPFTIDLPSLDREAPDQPGADLSEWDAGDAEALPDAGEAAGAEAGGLDLEVAAFGQLLEPTTLEEPPAVEDRSEPAESGESAGEIAMHVDPEEAERPPPVALDAAAAVAEAPEPGAVEYAEEVARRLDALAGRLRAEGLAGAEHEMASLDRLTALLAGVVAGYLARISGADRPGGR